MYVKYLNFWQTYFIAPTTCISELIIIFLCLHLREKGFKIQHWVLWLCWLSSTNEVSESCARWKLIVQSQKRIIRKMIIDRWNYLIFPFQMLIEFYAFLAHSIRLFHSFQQHELILIISNLSEGNFNHFSTSPQWVINFKYIMYKLTERPASTR